DEMPAAIPREPKPMAVSILGAGARGSREHPAEQLRLLPAQEHLAAGCRKLQISIRRPDSGVELSGSRATIATGSRAISQTSSKSSTRMRAFPTSVPEGG